MNYSFFYLTNSLLVSFCILFTSLKPNSSKFLKYFFTISCLIQSLLSSYTFRDFPFFPPLVYFYFQSAWFLNLYNTIHHPKLRGFVYRLFVSWPAGWYMGVTWCSIFLIPFHFAFGSILILSLFLFVSLGFIQSIYSHSFGDPVDIDLKNLSSVEPLSRISTPSLGSSKHLTIFQFTDTHIGNYMSVSRLRSICQQVVKLNPDLVFLTGDFFTRDAHHDPDALKNALEPLKIMKGKTFACLGNHDYECLDHVLNGLKDNDIVLLRDQDITVQTEKGQVQILGSSYVFGGGDRDHLESLFSRFPKLGSTKHHFTLLHHPGTFKFIPKDYGTLVFSGHLHGGQVGIFAFGFKFSILSIINFFKGEIFLPDHGLFGFGVNRLYSHRGTGHYGFPIRLGIPSEESLLKIHFE